ncbi:MAG: hypothetical protein IPP31_14275 [Chitinophagaceae bacterium]|nr:hypothetical protein [Chitinophagaceae bacterium]
MDFKDPIFIAYFITIFSSFIISILFINIKNKPAYLNYFFIYPSLAFILLLNKTLAHAIKQYSAIMPLDTIQIISNLSFIIHFLLLGTILIKNIELNSSKRLLYNIFIALLLSISLILITKDLKQKNGLAYGITNTFLIAFCLTYYYSLFKTPPNSVLIHNPAFWIINGVFFGMITTIPINFSGDLFFKVGNVENVQLFKKLGSLSYITMHLFFIKGYLCIIRPHKVF